MSVRVGDDGHCAVVGHVEPLVDVDRPRVGPLDPGGEVPGGRCGGGPQPERPVDVQPGAMVRARVGDRPEVVERASGDIARLRTDDRRSVVGGQCLCELVGVHPALVVGGYPDRRLRAKAKQPQRGVDRGVSLLATQDADRRRANQPVALHIPGHTG